MSQMRRSVKKRISEISVLNDDWDFQGASAVEPAVIKNCYKFINALDLKRLWLPSE